MSLFSWQFFLSCWLQKMDVESFQFSVTDPIQPLPPKLFFSPTLISQLWESNFPVTRAENNNKNRECSFNSPLTVPAQPLSSSHWFCVWLLSPSSFPLTLLSSGSHSHFLPICFQSTSFFFSFFFLAPLPILSFFVPLPFQDLQKRDLCLLHLWLLTLSPARHKPQA